MIKSSPPPTVSVKGKARQPPQPFEFFANFGP
jgi:hypothetical protein